MANKKFTEQDIDSLIGSIDSALAKAEALSKAEPQLRKDEGLAPAEEVPALEAAPAAEGAPEAAAQEAAPQDASLQEGAPAADAAQADEQIQQEQGGEQPLSDEELSSIYQAMPAEEAERHYMVLRQVLSAQMGGEQAEPQAEAAPQEQAPAPGAPAAPAPEMAMKGEVKMNAEANGGQMSKSEQDELKKSYADLENQLKKMANALEKALVPERKSVTQVAFLTKTEGEGQGNSGADYSNLSKKEKIAKLGELTKSGKLDADQRRVVNDFCITGNSEDKVNKILGGIK